MAITAIMAIVTAVLAIFVDLLPSAFQGTLGAPGNMLEGAQATPGN